MKIADPNCTRCGLCETTERVCVIPDVHKCDIMIVGEAPGGNEELTGELFSGRAGKLLMEVLNAHNITRDSSFITNAVSCRPPENRTPTKKEIAACRYWFQKQFTKVNPKFVLLLGNVPCQQALDLKGIKKLRGKPIERDGIVYLPTWHPAYVLREPKARQSFTADIRYFAEIIANDGIPREEGLDYVLVEDRADIEDMLKDLYGLVSYDIETTGLYPWAKDACINSFGFGTKEKQYIVPAQHKEAKHSDKTMLYMLDTLKARQDAGEIRFVAQNGKFDMLYTWVTYGVRMKVDFDTMLAHYLIDENERHGLKELSKVYFGAPDYDIDDETKFGRKGIKPLAYYQAHDLYYTRKLYFKLKKQLEADPAVKEVFDKILMPCSDLFTEIEKRGVFLNLGQFDEAEKYLTEEVRKAENDLNKFLPKDIEMNWGSPKQVGHLLYEVFKIPITTRTKKGKPSTSESALNQIDHPLVEALIRCRGAKQQLSFFIEGWKPFLDGKRLHPSFKLHGTVTGRPSCEHPNLQQVPRDPRIRSLIGAPPGWELLEADLSQIELRIAAELSDDSGLVHAFLNNIDPHWMTCMKEIMDSGAKPDLVLATASHIKKEKITNYGKACTIVLEAGHKAAVAFDDEWNELRKKAKAVNFGYLYGMWWKKFKQYALDNYGVRVTDEQAQFSRKSYFRTYPDLPGWHSRQKKFANKYGFVRSLSGRKRRLPRAQDREDTPERRESERQAINSPVQSFASDLNLMTALQLRKEFGTDVLHIVGTVHDSILMEVRKEYVDKVYKRVLEIMSHPDLLDVMKIRIGIPIEAEAKIGSWSKGVSLEKWKAAQNG